MLRRIILITFLAIVTCFSAHAEVFTVTSNADSGPGTLREALTKAAANGTTEKDFIYFNLPDLSEAGRTIVLSAQLPDLTSNLTIDASTQPGNVFGVSDSKVKLLVSDQDNNGLSGLYSYQQTDLEIYALFIDNDNPSLSINKNGAGILMIQCKRIKVGAPGKGCTITNFQVQLSFGIDLNVPVRQRLSDDVVIRSNFIGVDPDGVTACKINRLQSSFTDVKNLVFGGNNPADGNVVFGGIHVLNDNRTTGVSLGKTFIAHNKIGLSRDGSSLLINGSAFNSVLSISDFNNAISDCEVFNNLVTENIQISLGCFFKIKGNKVGTDITGTKVFPHASSGLLLSFCTGGAMIGGTAEEDKNIFAGSTGFENTSIGPRSTINSFESPAMEIVGNIFKCNNGLKAHNLLVKYVATPLITELTAGKVAGTAPANSRVDLYYTIECSYCEPQRLFASVTADQAGNWEYKAPLLNYPVSAAATSNGSTSEFTSLEFTNQPGDVIVKDACGGTGGSIKGIKVGTAVTYTWLNEKNEVISNQSELTNAPAGKYYLVVSNGNCSITSQVYEIKELTTPIDASALKITLASCGNKDGSITGLSAGTITFAEWRKSDGTVVGNQVDLTGAEAGTYTLTVQRQGQNCTVTYGPVTINNKGIPPALNETAATTTTTPCGQSTGSVTGIKVGPSDRTYYYSWKDRTNAEVANTPDLLNKPAGFYRLVVTDGTPCGTLTSAEYEIKEINGITIDISKARGQSDRCGLHNAGVTVPVTGATSYEWRNLDDGTIAGTQMNLTNVKAGRYQLTARNAFCSKNATFTLRADDAVVFPDFAFEAKGSCVDRATGSITVNTGTDPAFQPAYYIWEDAAGKVVGTDKAAVNLLPGKYRLTLIDKNGCRNFYKEYTVPAYDILTFAQYGTVNHIKCGLGTGGVTATIWKGGSGKFSYQWYDGNDQPIPGKTDNFINDVPAGKYRLHLTDEEGCTPGDISFEIRDDQETPNVPVVANIDVCENGPGVIRVINPYLTAIYRLYDSPTSTTVLDEKIDGVFKINITETRSYYVALTYGECESARAEVKVSLGDISGKIANTFTPNADGHNDYWQIPGIENYTNGVVSIFSRNGQMIYQSKGYANPFDGTYKGKELPAGVYYYVIDLKKCNLVSGNLTIIR